MNVDVPSGVSPSDVVLAFDIPEGARLWLDAARTTEVLPTETFALTEPSLEMEVFVEDANSTGGTFQLAAFLQDSATGQQVQRKQKPVVFEKIELLANDFLKEEIPNRAKDWLRGKTDDTLDPLFDAVRTNIDTQIDSLDPLDPNDQQAFFNLIQVRDTFLSQWRSKLVNSAVDTVFERTVSNLNFVLPGNSKIKPIFQATQPGTGSLEDESGFEFDIDVDLPSVNDLTQDQAFQNALQQAAGGDFDSFKDWLWPPTFINSVSLDVDYITTTGKVFKFSLGLSDFQSDTDFNFNNAFMKFTIPKSNWPNLLVDDAWFRFDYGPSSGSAGISIFGHISY